MHTGTPAVLPFRPPGIPSPPAAFSVVRSGFGRPRNFFHSSVTIWGRTGFDGEQGGSRVRAELALVKRHFIPANDNYALAA